MNCSRIGCAKHATKSPVLSFAAEIMPHGKRAEVQLPLPVCDEHAQHQVDLFLSDEGWEHIRRVIVANGLAEPGRDTAAIDFIALQ